MQAAPMIVKGAMIAGSALKAYGTIRQGQSADMAGRHNQAQAENQAAALDIQAGQEEAAGSHRAERIAARAKEIQALQIAAAAAGGGSSTDGSVVAHLGETAKRSTLDQQLEIILSQETAQQIRHEAKTVRAAGAMARYEGKQAKKAAFLGAGVGLLQSGADWYDRYGGNKDKPSGNNPAPKRR